MSWLESMRSTYGEAVEVIYILVGLFALGFVFVILLVVVKLCASWFGAKIDKICGCRHDRDNRS